MIAQGFAADILVFLLGLSVGSFLNVLALRTLQEKSLIFPPSHCPKCRHNLGFMDNIPLLSYLMLKGKCRYCQVSISWQYPVVELFTAITFLILYKSFGFTVEFAGMCFFASTLIATTVTDFREKLIPHDITYPSMLVGIAYSAIARHDLLGAMAGIGASYIIFDFLAHYGLKAYMAFSPQDTLTAGNDSDLDSEEPALDEAFSLAGDQGQEEAIEVMGGGDAVLSAVIAAWLGWQKLVVALAVGFLVGTLMGVAFLVKEMHKANILKLCIKPAALGGILGFALLGGPMYYLSNLTSASGPAFTWLLAGLAGAVGGSLIGIVSVGTRVSKPFPFGPALAAGAFVAIFYEFPS